NEIETLRNQLDAGFRSVSTQPADAPRVVNAVFTSPEASSPAAPAAAAASPALPQEQNKPPFSFKAGNAEFTLGGYADMTAVFRTSTLGFGSLGGGIATGFNTVPFNNTIQGNLTEARFSAQSSLVSLHVNDQIGGANVTAHVEADFLGNHPSNLFV